MASKIREELTGKQFGKLTVLADVSRSKPRTRWFCKCSCEFPPVCKVLDSYQLVGNRAVRSCGCGVIDAAKKVIAANREHHKARDLTGLSFNRLTVVERVESTSKGVRWKCRCACGNYTIQYAYNIVSEKHPVKSCGCYQAECARDTIKFASKAARKHGLARTPEYRAWWAAVSRCCNPEDDQYSRYGGRGITVDPRWLGEYGCVQFIRDMGKRPGEDFSLDRINNDGPYSPDNCRWATRVQQQANRRVTVFLTSGGVTKPLTEWAAEMGSPSHTLRNRRNNGWTDDEILNTPVVRRQNRGGNIRGR